MITSALILIKIRKERVATIIITMIIMFVKMRMRVWDKRINDCRVRQKDPTPHFTDTILVAINARQTPLVIIYSNYPREYSLKSYINVLLGSGTKFLRLRFWDWNKGFITLELLWIFLFCIDFLDIVKFCGGKNYFLYI